MECSLARNTQRRREREMFLINFHPCTLWGQAGRFFSDGSSPRSQPWSALISTSRHTNTHINGTKGGLNLLGWLAMWAGRTRGRHCINTGAARTSLNRRNSGGREGVGENHWMLALTRHPVGIASQRVAGHCEGATVISLWTGLVMTGRPMGFWEMATVHDGPYSTHDMAPASNTVLAAWTKLRLLEETGQSPSTVCFGRKMENVREGLPHLTGRQLPTAYKTMHTHTKFGQNIYIAHNPGH